MELKYDERGNIVWSKKRASVFNEGNLAFKCTYNDNDYCGVCNDETYRYNVKAGRVWCGDEDNDCRDFINKEVSKTDFPCYESALFMNWSFGAGVRRGDKYYGKPFSMKKAYPKKLAFLTTRDPNEEEEDRYIFGFLHIKDVDQIKDPTIKQDVMIVSEFILGDPEKSLTVLRKVIFPRVNIGRTGGFNV